MVKNSLGTKRWILYYVLIDKLRARIAELWRFKVRKVKKLQEKDHLAIFKPGLWQKDFFGCGEELYHFQQELMVSKMIVKQKV